MILHYIFMYHSETHLGLKNVALLLDPSSNFRRRGAPSPSCIARISMSDVTELANTGIERGQCCFEADSAVRLLRDVIKLRPKINMC